VIVASKLDRRACPSSGQRRFGLQRPIDRVGNFARALEMLRMRNAVLQMPHHTSRVEFCLQRDWSSQFLGRFKRAGVRTAKASGSRSIATLPDGSCQNRHYRWRSVQRLRGESRYDRQDTP